MMRAIAVLVFVVGCYGSNLVPCGDLSCPGGEICVDGAVCATREQLSVCMGLDQNAACITTGGGTGRCDRGVCFTVGCGNHVVDPTEVCDDGNTTSGDGCNATCTSLEVCGNGVIDIGEQCDCGSTEATRSPSCETPNSDTDRSAVCRTTCILVRCGNLIIDEGEICDDGNNLPNDGCNATCTSTGECGNGTLDPGEQCDLGPANSDDGDSECRTTCAIPTCGDGIVDDVRLSEECDAGAANSNAANAPCRLGCKLPRCGDHIVDNAGTYTAAEVCDDGNLVPGDGCRYDCASNETCGNGLVDFFTSEQCDDANNIASDACTNACLPARCGDGVVWDGHEACDDGNNFNTDDCRNDCTVPTCGDGFVWAGHEGCDDQNLSNTDACLNNCQLATCGDGYIRDGVEQCELPLVGDCDQDCQYEICGNGYCSPWESCYGTMGPTECGADCGSCCGNAYCDYRELCYRNGQNPDECEDCGICTPICGDGICQDDEQCGGPVYCVSDCGSC